jgi:hypothetical protein
MFANLSLERQDDFVDNITNNWPVPEEHLPRLDLIKHSHRAHPLNVIYKGDPVCPLDVENMIHDAMVEVMFDIKHCRFYADNRDQSCFTGTIKQILPLRPLLV